MPFIYIGIGAFAMAAAGGSLWGMIFLLELLFKTIGLSVMQYVVAAPMILMFSYFLGGAIHSLRAGR